MKNIFFIFFLFSQSILANTVEHKCFDSQIETREEYFKLSERANSGLNKSIEDALEISVISLKEAHQIFNLLKSKRYIPYDYTKRGCEARAHEMARIMDSMCLNSAKAFLKGHISFKNVSWYYHVAPILYVQIKDKIIPYAFDPSVTKTVTPLYEWIETLQRGNILGDYKLEITNQYVYKPQDEEISRASYRLRDTAKTKVTLGLFKAFETANEFPSDVIHLLKKFLK